MLWCGVAELKIPGLFKIVLIKKQKTYKNKNKKEENAKKPSPPLTYISGYYFRLFFGYVRRCLCGDF